jgi:hypothetical protein
MSFWYFSVVPKYLNVATFSNDSNKKINVVKTSDFLLSRRWLEHSFFDLTEPENFRTEGNIPESPGPKQI